MRVFRAVHREGGWAADSAAGAVDVVVVVGDEVQALMSLEERPGSPLARSDAEWNSSSRLVAHGLAILCPLIVLGLATAYFTRSEPAVLSEHAAQFETVLDRQQPQIVAVGNSILADGIDRAQLSRELGVTSVTKLPIHDSGRLQPARTWITQAFSSPG